MDLVSLIDIRKIVLSGHQNVVKNLEEYERLNFSLQKRKQDNFENAKNANSSSSSIEENIEIYEEDNEDDDEPIEALIRGKVKILEFFDAKYNSETLLKICKILIIIFASLKFNSSAVFLTTKIRQFQNQNVGQLQSSRSKSPIRRTKKKRSSQSRSNLN